MSEPEVHTLGIAKYVYASAYDALRERIAELEAMYSEALETSNENFVVFAKVTAERDDLLGAAKEIVDIIDKGILKEGYVCDSFTAQPLRIAIAKCEGSRA